MNRILAGGRSRRARRTPYPDQVACACCAWPTKSKRGSRRQRTTQAPRTDRRGGSAWPWSRTCRILRRGTRRVPHTFAAAVRSKQGMLRRRRRLLHGTLRIVDTCGQRWSRSTSHRARNQHSSCTHNREQQWCKFWRQRTRTAQRQPVASPLQSPKLVCCPDRERERSTTAILLRRLRFLPRRA